MSLAYQGYDFQKSRALKNEGEFYGLALDEDNQYELTKSRCELWVPQVVAAFTERGLELQSALPADVPNDEILLDYPGLL